MSAMDVLRKFRSKSSAKSRLDKLRAELEAERRNHAAAAAALTDDLSYAAEFDDDAAKQKSDVEDRRESSARRISELQRVIPLAEADAKQELADNIERARRQENEKRARKVEGLIPLAAEAQKHLEAFAIAERELVDLNSKLGSPFNIRWISDSEYKRVRSSKPDDDENYADYMRRVVKELQDQLREVEQPAVPTAAHIAAPTPQPLVHPRQPTVKPVFDGRGNLLRYEQVDAEPGGLRTALTPGPTDLGIPTPNNAPRLQDRLIPNHELTAQERMGLPPALRREREGGNAPALPALPRLTPARDYNKEVLDAMRDGRPPPPPPVPTPVSTPTPRDDLHRHSVVGPDPAVAQEVMAQIANSPRPGHAPPTATLDEGF